MYCAAFLDLSPRKFKSESNNGKRRIAHDLPPYRAAYCGGLTPCIACIWVGVPVPAIGAFYSDPSATTNLDSKPPTGSWYSSFGPSVRVISSKNKAILAARIAFGKGEFVCGCHATALFTAIFSFNNQYCWSLLEWQSRFCFSFYAGTGVLFFGQALSGPDGALDEVEKRRPGTSY